MIRTLLILLLGASPLAAGIYPLDGAFEIAPDGTAIPLPFNAVFRIRLEGRAGAMNPESKLKDQIDNRKVILARIASQQAIAKRLPIPEFLQHTSDLLAVNEPTRALELLRLRTREEQPNFQLHSNLVMAYAQAGEFDSAFENALDLEELLKKKPDDPKLAWQARVDAKYLQPWLKYQRDLARKDFLPANAKPIPVFGTKPPPPDAIAVLQRMALDSPRDLYLLWTLAEAYANAEQYRESLVLFNKCTDSGLTQPVALRARREEVMRIVESLPPEQDAPLLGGDAPAPPQPGKWSDLVSSPERAFGVAAAFVVVTAALVVLQVRASRRRKRRRLLRRPGPAG